MQTVSEFLALRLKKLRTERGWSLTQAAQATGVSKAMLGQIERGESSPTVSTLWKIATGFNVAFSSFITVIAPTTGLVPVKTVPVFDSSNAQMVVTPLFAFEQDLGFEMFRIELAAGAESYSDAHETAVIEHIIILEGQLKLEIAGQSYQLSTGDGMRFAADQPHAYKNNSANSCVMHNLIHYPVAHKKAESNM
ncbi:XRE family transcriptional regulator [Pseudomonas sp. F1_0610]|uniref:helix-turn-helix domain-containing protein n=1 Tax=Pseudomonas sp. F1_0610 TaxID=3114284 RepID=UPI0039C2B602